MLSDIFSKCPIHYAAYFGQSQVTSFLINQDPSCVSKTINQNGRRNLPLHVACISQFAEFETVKVLYNAYPEAIYTRNANGRLVTDCAKGMGVKFFLETQMSYALKAKDYAVMAFCKMVMDVFHSTMLYVTMHLLVLLNC